MEKLKIYISGDRIFSNSQKAYETESSKKLGEKKDGKIIYSCFEAFFLKEENKAEIIKNNKSLSLDSALNMFSKEKDFYIKYLVFKHLRKKGFIVKTGSKFGTEFRVYEYKSLNKHAKYTVLITKKSEKMNLQDLIASSRVAHSTGKKLLLAIVDSEENILFYEIDWKKI